jgi:hypothetical protein
MLRLFNSRLNKFLLVSGPDTSGSSLSLSAPPSPWQCCTLPAALQPPESPEPYSAASRPCQVTQLPVTASGAFTYTLFPSLPPVCLSRKQLCTVQ